jgi:CBS domain-containing protein
METGIKVGDCMKTSLITISEDASVYDAAVKMKDKDVSCLLVTDAKGKIYALVTDADLVRNALAPKKLGVKIKEIASKPLIGLEPDKDISEAANIMGAKNIKRLVVFKGSNVAGIISARDIVRISPSLYDLIAEKERVKT